MSGSNTRGGLLLEADGLLSGRERGLCRLLQGESFGQSGRVVSPCGQQGGDLRVALRGLKGLTRGRDLVGQIPGLSGTIP